MYHLVCVEASKGNLSSTSITYLAVVDVILACDNMVLVDIHYILNFSNSEIYNQSFRYFTMPKICDILCHTIFISSYSFLLISSLVFWFSERDE